MKKTFRSCIAVVACAAFGLSASDDISEIVKRVAFENEQQKEAFECTAVQYVISLQQHVRQQSPVDERAIQELYTDPAARGSYDDVYTIK